MRQPSPPSSTGPRPARPGLAANHRRTLGGHDAGRFRPHHDLVVTEISRGHGRYLTFGHIDHGTLMSVEYYWANGEHLTVRLRGDALVDHIRLITEDGRLTAAVTRHG